MARKPIIPLKDRNQKHINVTYSKRRKTLFSKAGQIASEFNIPIAVVVSSAGKQLSSSKFYGFGNPSVEDVFDAYLCNGNATRMDDGMMRALMEKVNAIGIHELKKQSSDGFDGDGWWNQDIEDMGLDELIEFGRRIEKLKVKVKNKLDSISNSSSAVDLSSANCVATRHGFVDTSSSAWMMA